MEVGDHTVYKHDFKKSVLLCNTCANPYSSERFPELADTKGKMTHLRKTKCKAVPLKYNFNMYLKSMCSNVISLQKIKIKWNLP